LDINTTGVGPAFENSIGQYFEDNPIEMTDVFSPDDLADLFGQLKDDKGDLTD